MKGRESKGPPSADLLVCFPSRAHLALMPKPICSPARPAEPSKRHLHRRNPSRGNASPVLWAKPKRPAGSEEMSSEPTSPKVTCAGQIKVVRPKTTACKNWQSVMEEIERIHNDKKNKKKGSWGEAFGFKKDVMNFLSCMRRVKFDFRCFGSFPSSEIESEEEDDDDDEGEDHLSGLKHEEIGDGSSKAVFSKWFMVLQEEQKGNFAEKEGEMMEKTKKEDEIVQPPRNALLLMRCRSAPAKSWLEEREEEEREKEEGKERRNSLAMVMKCDTEFYQVSPDIIVKETWISGGMSDYLSRSRSCKSGMAYVRNLSCHFFRP